MDAEELVDVVDECGGIARGGAGCNATRGCCFSLASRGDDGGRKDSGKGTELHKNPLLLLLLLRC